MKWPFLAVVVCGAVALSAQAPPRDLAVSQERTAAIRGRVLAAVDGAPIRKARVSVSSTGDDRDPVFTDDEGRFEFGALPAGRYSVSAIKSGYATTRFGARQFLDRAIPIVVTSGSVADPIDIRMPKGAAITGRVVDDLGDPFVGANVTAGRVVRTEGRPRLVAAASAQTDDLGEYRLAGLPAGSYIVSVSSRPNENPGSFDGVGAGEATSWARLYHPSTANLAQAQSLSLRAGDTIPSIDFSLTPIRRPGLSLTVSDQTGQPAEGTFTLTSISSFDVFNRSGPIRDGTGGTSIEPGEWTLLVRGRQGVAIASLSVETDDVSVNLVVGRPGRLSGRVVFDSPTRLPPGQLTLEAMPRDAYPGPAVRMQATARVNADGTFAMTNLIGARRFRLRGAPGGWSLKSLTLKGRSLLEGPVEFAGGEEWTGAVAVVTDRHAELTGTVVNQEGGPIKDYSVLVFPDERSRWADPIRWLRWVRPNQHGSFTVDDLPPGPYLAVALSDVDGADWSDEASLDSVRPYATKVLLGESGTTTLSLRLVSTP